MDFIVLFLSLLIFLPLKTYAQDLPLHLLKHPPGFAVTIYAKPIQDARQMTLGSKDIVFVGSRKEGKVYAVIPDKNSKYGTRVLTLASGLTMPNGVAFYKGDLYVADVNRVLLFKQIESHLNNPPKPIIINNALPSEDSHGWRFIRFGPDNKLYIGVGAPCNNCLKEDPRFASIMRMNPDGSQLEIYAKGVRNTVGFDWSPSDHKLWFSDNGRDWLSDNTPPDELNYAPHSGMNFGFPYCHGKNVADPEFGHLHACHEFTAPELELPAHVAALDVTFYTGRLFPSEYYGQLFISEHGSWNRKQKIGYQVIAVKLKNNKVTEVKPFIWGWLQSDKVWGRPVASLVLRDGSLLISDDYANVIYRVNYAKK
ncbi:L-sorbosone dehydrogenase [Legionella beliardensis]|uniref:L-sorbosone dehydrogenase n=1 Tax=Legionella beliardensis TaxID=91822 RepID=A0A378I061_9GAMM|nr:PQQ-dependent sugar dehydrogenase [Legionella beliardensis]STX28577.1 L-sorbosone dehydrogenase [Legionella beliardensis]